MGNSSQAIENIFPNYTINMVTNFPVKSIIVKRNNQKQQYLLLQKNQQNENMLDMQYKLLQKRLELRNPFIIQLIEVKYKIEENLCSNNYCIFSIIDYVKCDLKQLLENYRKQQQVISLQEIVYIVWCVLSGLAYLEIYKIQAQSLTLSTIYVTHNQIYKIADCELFLNSQNQQEYLSPQQLQVHQNGFEVQPDHVFSLGIIILSLCSLQKPEEFYDYSNFKINTQLLNKRVSQIKKHFGNEMFDFIMSLINFDQNKRVSVKEALKNIKQIDYEKQLKVQERMTQNFKIQDDNFSSDSKRNIVLNQSHDQSLVFLGNKLSLNNKFSDFRKSRIQKSYNSLESIYQTTFSQMDNKLYLEHKIPSALLPAQAPKDKYQSNIFHQDFDQIEEECEDIKVLKNGIYKGSKLQGNKVSYGVFNYFDGSYYEGEFYDYQFQGRGSLYNQKQELIYEGEFQRNQFSGYGVYYNPNSQTFQDYFNLESFDQLDNLWLKYEGNFFQDQKNGPGTLYISNGEYLQAEWLNDKVNGFGIYYGLNGEQIEGEWRDNKLI